MQQKEVLIIIALIIGLVFLLNPQKSSSAHVQGDYIYGTCENSCVESLRSAGFAYQWTDAEWGFGPRRNLGYTTWTHPKLGHSATASSCSAGCGKCTISGNVPFTTSDTRTLNCRVKPYWETTSF